MKQSSEEKTKAMEEQIHSKIQLAAEKREEIEKEMLEKLNGTDNLTNFELNCCKDISLS